MDLAQIGLLLAVIFLAIAVSIAWEIRRDLW